MTLALHICRCVCPCCGKPCVMEFTDIEGRAPHVTEDHHQF